MSKFVFDTVVLTGSTTHDSAQGICSRDQSLWGVGLLSMEY